MLAARMRPVQHEHHDMHSYLSEVQGFGEKVQDGVRSDRDQGRKEREERDRPPERPVENLPNVS